MTSPKDEEREAAEEYAMEQLPILDEESEGIFIQSTYPEECRADIRHAFLAGAACQRRMNKGKMERLIEAAQDWCDSTEEECGHQPEWQALSEALRELEQEKA